MLTWSRCLGRPFQICPVPCVNSLSYFCKINANMYCTVPPAKFLSKKTLFQSLKSSRFQKLCWRHFLKQMPQVYLFVMSSSRHAMEMVSLVRSDKI